MVAIAVVSVFTWKMTWEARGDSVARFLHKHEARIVRTSDMRHV